MTKSLVTGMINATIAAAAATAFWSIATGKLQNSGTETNESFTWRTAGTFSNMYCFIPANTVSADSNLRFRTGAANGNQNVVVTASTTGSFSDTSDIDTISAGAIIDYGFTAGATGTSLIIGVCSVLFAPTTADNTVNKFGCLGLLTDTSANTSYYQPLGGNLSTAANSTTQANAQFKNKISSTMKNMVIRVTANTASVATVKSQIAAATAGNLNCSISSGATGIIEDTSDTDVITSGTLINTVLLSTVTTSLSLRLIAVDLVNSGGKTHYMAADAGAPTAIATSLTRYLALGSGMGFDGTSTNVLSVPNIPFVASNLEAYVQANSITANSTAYFNFSGGVGNQNIIFGSGVTGYQEDTTDSDIVSPTSSISYRVITGGTGSSIAFANIGFLASYPFSNFNDPLWFGMVA